MADVFITTDKVQEVEMILTKESGADNIAPGTVESSAQGYQDTVDSGDTLVIPDINITKNDDSIVTAEAAINLDLGVIDPFPATWDEMVAAYGIGYNYPAWTGIDAQFRTGDDLWVETNIFAAARLTNDLKPQQQLGTTFLTLENNNSFGNKTRFTDSVGGTTYGAGNGSLSKYVIDNYTGLGWYFGTGAAMFTSLGNPQFNYIIDQCNAETDYFTDWFAPNYNQYLTLGNSSLVAATLFYSPWKDLYTNVTAIASNDLPTSTTVRDFTSRAVFVNLRANAGMGMSFYTRTTNGSSINFFGCCRRHF